MSASGTGTIPSLRSVVRHWPSACVWLSALLIVEAGAGLGHQLMTYAQEVLSDDVKTGVGKQMVDVGNAPRH